MSRRLLTMALFMILPAWAVAGDDEPEPQPGGRAKLGKPAPDFTLKDFDGKTHKLSDLSDKIVVLEWFNKDCPFCKLFCKELKQTASKYAEKGVVWFAVDSTHYRTDEENKDYHTDNKLPYPILSDFDGRVGKLYGASVTPHCFIIEKGVLVYEGAFVSKDKKKNHVAAALNALLAGKPVKSASVKPFG